MVKVPEHALGQPLDGGVNLSAQFHGQVVARKHHLVYLLVHLGLIVLYPGQLGRRKVARRVEQRAQTGGPA